MRLRASLKGGFAASKTRYPVRPAAGWSSVFYLLVSLRNPHLFSPSHDLFRLLCTTDSGLCFRCEKIGSKNGIAGGGSKMGSGQKNGWLGLAGLATAGILLFSMLYYLQQWRMRPETYSSDPGKDKIVLKVDEGVRIGHEKIIYKGLAGDGRLTMAVVLLDMDPEYPYIHEIGIRKAKDGFSLVGHRFRLISASRRRVLLWHIKKPPVLAMAGPGSPLLPKPWLGPKNAWGP